MKIEKIEPKIVTYKLTFDKDDENYVKNFMWARFILDYDTWRLTINSDIGDYTYSWGLNENDNFTSLMARVDKDYLLGKMSSRSKFFVNKSKNKTIETIEYNGWGKFGIDSKEQWENIKEEIYNIDECSSEETFFREVSKIVPDIDFECIEIVKDYPHGAYVAIGLFIKHIQPILKEEWEKVNAVNLRGVGNE